MAAIKRYLGTVCLLLCVAALPGRALSQTYQAEYNGTTYEFYLTSDEPDTLSLLQDQFWWVSNPDPNDITGSGAIAASVAEIIGTELTNIENTAGIFCDAGVNGCSPRVAYSVFEGTTFYAYYNPTSAGPVSYFADFAESGSNASYVVARAVPVPEISASGATASLASIFALMLLLREAMMRRKVASNNA